MFRARPRPEKSSRAASAQRGSVGSARVWDERTRALRVAGPAPDRASAPPGPAPDELAALVRGIVRVTLDTRLGELEPPRRASLALELERRLLDVFRPTPTAPPAPALDQPPEEGATLVPADAPETPAELLAEEAPWTSPARAPLPPALRAFVLVLEERLARLGEPLAQRSDLRQLLAELTLSARPQQVEGDLADPEHLRNLDVLARRAAKLERALHDARAALAYVSGLERVDAGIASIYRQVQGLAHDDPRREQKAGALAKIFRANLELRGRSDQSESSRPT